MTGCRGRKETRVKGAEKADGVICEREWSINRKPPAAAQWSRAAIARGSEAARLIWRRPAEYETERQRPVQSQGASVTNPERGWLVVRLGCRQCWHNLGAGTVRTCYL